MSLSDLLTKIVLPLLVPLVAVITGAIAFRRERGYERRKRGEIVFTMAAYAADLYSIVVQHVALGKPSPEHFREFQTAFESIITTIMSEPEVGRRFYSDVHFKGGRNNMFRLLAEARIRVANAGPNKQLDAVVALALYTVIYLYDKDANRRKEMYGLISQISGSNPVLFENLTVAEDTPCLAT